MSFGRQSAWLGAAGLIEYAAQLMLPVILVRHLTQAEFGDYRLFWLIAGSAVAVFPFFLPQSLFYLLPRNEGLARARLLGNTTAALLMLGMLAAAALAAAAPALSSPVASLVQNYPSVLAFTALWVASSLFDTLAVADGRALWQARTAIALSVTRTASLGAAAIVASDVHSVFGMACLFAAGKFAVAFAYACHFPTRTALRLEKTLLIEQLRYSAPFALGTAIFALRTQADQWVVASMFSSEVFAIVSIGAVATAVSTLVRQPLTNVLLPLVSAAFKRRDFAASAAYVRKGSLAILLVSLPLYAWLYVVAPDLVTLVYTDRYLPAADVMRAYVLGLSITTFGAGYLLPVLNLGRQAATLPACGLVISVVVSYAAASVFGYVGAVAGSMLSLALMEYWALSMVARRLETRMATLCDVAVALRATICVGLAVVAGMTAASWLGRFGPETSLAGSSLVFAAACLVAAMPLRLGATIKALRKFGDSAGAMRR